MASPVTTFYCIYERNKVTTAKKATSPSLKDLLDKKDEDPVVTQPAPGSEIDEQGSGEVIDSEPGVDEQVSPDGVTFSGGQNVMNKTPADLAAESPAETAARFGLSDEIPEQVAKDPNVQVYADDQNYQIPGGTHLHPDVARDNYNRNLNNAGSSVSSTRTVTENVYATPSERDDKFIVDSE